MDGESNSSKVKGIFYFFILFYFYYEEVTRVLPLRESVDGLKPSTSYKNMVERDMTGCPNSKLQIRSVSIMGPRSSENSQTLSWVYTNQLMDEKQMASNILDMNYY